MEAESLESMLFTKETPYPGIQEILEGAAVNARKSRDIAYVPY